jgi:hypothetical protein
VLAGELAAGEGLRRVAHSGGWPIETPSGFLFARHDDGAGPYRLAGDFNAWTGAEMALQSGAWFVTVAIAEPDGAKYKLVAGDGSFAADPFARRYGYDEYGEHSLVRASGAHLERWPELGAEGVAARTLRVWVPRLPPTHHLYAHDGQNLFDPAAPFGSWKLADAVSDTTLVAGIDNTGAGRMREYTQVEDVIGGQSIGGGAPAYVAFVADTLRPFIESRYGKPARTGLIGSSLGGLVTFFQALEQPARWDFAASLSGTFGWGSIGASNPTLIARFSATDRWPIVLYLDSGGGPGSGCVDSDGDGVRDDTADAKDNYCETEQLKQILEARGWQQGADLWHWWEPDAPHSEAAWAARVFRPVEVFEGL